MYSKSLTQKLFLACAISLAIASVAFSQVILEEKFEIPSYSDLKGWREHGGCRPHSFAIVQDPCSKDIKNKVVKITNIMGADNRTCANSTWSKPVTGNSSAFKHRTELIPASEATRVKPGEDFWLGMRIYVDKTYPSGTNLINFHVTQIIPATNATGTDMALIIDAKGNWDFSVMHKKQFQASIDRGKWSDWVIHFKRSTKNDGVVEVWKDLKKIVNFKGVTSQNNDPRGLWKFGLYRGREVKKDHFGKAYVVYFDDVKIAHGPNQFGAVSPDVNASNCIDKPTEPELPECVYIGQNN